MKRKIKAKQPGEKTLLITGPDRKLLAEGLHIVPTIAFKEGKRPKIPDLAEFLGIAPRTFSALMSQNYDSARVLKSIHSALSRQCSGEQQSIQQAVRQALHLDELLEKYFPLLSPERAAGVSTLPANPGAGSSSAPYILSPEAANLQILRLVAFAQELDAPARKKLESLVRCSTKPLIHSVMAGLQLTVSGLEQLMESFSKLIADGAGLPVQRIRGHLHVIGEAPSRGGHGTSPALLPVVSFTLVHSRDSIQPVYLDLGWYCIAKCATSDRTILHTIKVNDRPNTKEAIEVPELDWVLAHPLRNPHTDKVFGVISFDCLSDETSRTGPAESLKALRWGKPESDQPNPTIKGTLQEFGGAVAKFLFACDLRVWVAER